MTAAGAPRAPDHDEGGSAADAPRAPNSESGGCAAGAPRAPDHDEGGCAADPAIADILARLRAAGRVDADYAARHDILFCAVDYAGEVRRRATRMQESNVCVGVKPGIDNGDTDYRAAVLRVAVIAVEIVKDLDIKEGK